MSRSPATELLLERHGVTWTHDPAFDLWLIDIPASVTNQARFEAIDAPTVERYIEAVQDGADFPDIIVRTVTRDTGTTKHVLVSGNHRTRAHLDAGVRHRGVYLIDCDDVAALELAYSENATHGLPPTDPERISHALVLVEKGRTVADACRTVGIARGKVEAQVKSEAGTRRAARLGIPGEFARLATSTQATLASVKEDRVFTHLVKTIERHGIGAGPAGAQRLIGDANSQPDATSAIAIINLRAADYAREATGQRATGRPSENPFIKLRMALGTIRGLNASDVVDRCTSVEETHQLLLDGARHLMAIDKLLQVEQRPMKAVR